MIEARNLVKHFSNTKAVDGISFKSVGSNGIFGLLGPNGAGKSTTIRMIMNIIAPDSGEILFNGKAIKEEDKNRIGYLPEERGLYKKSKVGELLTYFAELKGEDRRSIQTDIDRWLDRFNLLNYKNKKVEDLSKGMSQKVQFITSVLHDPELIFLDEPFSGLDPVSVDLLRETVIDLGKKGKNILFSTHIMEQAEKICSEIFIINKGKEVISGSLENIKTKHSKNKVAIEFDGDGDFIKDLPFVDKIVNYPRYIEITLDEKSNPDNLLEAIVGKVSVSRFETKTTSLHNIFVNLVGEGVNPDNTYGNSKEINKMEGGL